MRKHPFVCSRCHVIVDWAGARFEERVELRTVGHTESKGSEVVAYYCKDCMWRRRAEIKGIELEQGTLI